MKLISWRTSLSVCVAAMATACSDDGGCETGCINSEAMAVELPVVDLRLEACRNDECVSGELSASHLQEASAGRRLLALVQDSGAPVLVRLEVEEADGGLVRLRAIWEIRPPEAVTGGDELRLEASGADGEPLGSAVATVSAEVRRRSSCGCTQVTLEPES